MKFCILLRFSAQFSELVTKLLNKSGITDYIFTDNVSFADDNSKNNKIWPVKSVSLIIIVDSIQLESFEIKMKSEINLNDNYKNKIRYFVIPVYKEN